MHSGFQTVRDAMPFNCRRRAAVSTMSSEARGEIERIARIWRECRARYGNDGPFLFGGFTIADAMYAPVVLRFRSYVVPLGDVERRYSESMLALPALGEWLAAAEAEGMPLPKYDKIA
jgi:glutathione S-transferase